MIRKLETMSAAIAFAEAGEFETAKGLLSELNGRFVNHRRNIVIVAKDTPFSPEPLEYALGLAGRLRCNALFLNILTGSPANPRTAMKHVSGFKNLFQDMTARLWPTARPSIAHEHMVLNGDFRLLLKEACRRLQRVEMVIIQKPKFEPCAHDLQVPVFCFDM